MFKAFQAYGPNNLFDAGLNWINYSYISNSVANPGCLTPILISFHPGSWISDPKTTKKEGEKLLLIFFL
jgi:hypothetical protein